MYKLLQHTDYYNIQIVTKQELLIVYVVLATYMLLLHIDYYNI